MKKDRAYYIKKIETIVNKASDKQKHSENNVWLTIVFDDNSECEYLISRVCYMDGRLGVVCISMGGDTDFFSLDVLTDMEIVSVYESLI